MLPQHNVDASPVEPADSEELMPPPKKPPSRGRGEAREAPLPPEQRQKLAERLIGRMEELGWIKSNGNPDIQRVVDASGIAYTTIYEISKATRPNPGLATIIAVARGLDCPLAWLIGTTDSFDAATDTATVPIVGAVEIGAYKQDFDFAMQDHMEQVRDLQPLDQRFAEIPHFPVKVLDGQLEGLTPPVIQGMVAWFIDFAKANIHVESGKVYLLHRRNSDGRFEHVFWRATVNRDDSIEFAPVTKNAQYNDRQKWKISRDELYSSDRIRIGGLFYGATFQYL